MFCGSAVVLQQPTALKSFEQLHGNAGNFLNVSWAESALPPKTKAEQLEVQWERSRTACQAHLTRKRFSGVKILRKRCEELRESLSAGSVCHSGPAVPARAAGFLTIKHPLALSQPAVNTRSITPDHERRSLCSKIDS